MIVRRLTSGRALSFVNVPIFTPDSSKTARGPWILKNRSAFWSCNLVGWNGDWSLGGSYLPLFCKMQKHLTCFRWKSFRNILQFLKIRHNCQLVYILERFSCKHVEIVLLKNVFHQASLSSSRSPRTKHRFHPGVFEPCGVQNGRRSGSNKCRQKLGKTWSRWNVRKE